MWLENHGRPPALLLVPAAGVAILVAAGQAHATGSPAACAYRLRLSALTDQQRAQLSVTIFPRGVCRVPAVLKAVKVRAQPGTAVVRRVNVRAPDGRAVVALGRVHSRTRLLVTILLRARGRTRVLAGRTTVRLRPDLVITRFRVPAQALTGGSFLVTAQIAEPTGGVGATAQVVLATGTTTLATVSVSVRPYRPGRVAVPVTLSGLGSFDLTLRIVSVSPAETNSANNTANAVVEVTEFQLDAAQVLVPSLAGYGVQFNQNVYAAISRSAGVTDANVGDMEQKIVALGPQLARVFFQAGAFSDPDLMQSFVRTARLAQRAGATINVTWQGGSLSDATIARFAAVLVDLLENQGITRLRWVTLQNEVNSTRITMDQYEHMYRVLASELAAAGDRTQIRFMGGDLVGGRSPLGQTQTDWLTFLATRMADLLDAYSIHVYWNYWDSGRLVQRLQDVRAIYDTLPLEGRKPLYVSEYGVRGRRSLNGVSYPEPGVWDDGTALEQTNLNAFQHAWFDILAAKLGYAGTIKWDAYFGRYAQGVQDYSLIGPPQQGWPLRPVYHVLHLIAAGTRPGWQVVSVNGQSGTKLLAGYLGPAGQVTVVGLDTSGATLNAVSPNQVSYNLGGLPPDTTMTLEIWNQDGSGGLSQGGTVQSDAAGVATVNVPQHAVFALTTLPSAV